MGLHVFDGYSPLCYTFAGGAAVGLSRVTWPLMNYYFKTHTYLAMILPTRQIYAIQMILLVGYAEALKAIQQIKNLTEVPLEVVECLKEEVDIRLSLFRDPSVDKATMNEGETFDASEESKDVFKAIIDQAFKWLESKGTTCSKSFERPANMCKWITLHRFLEVCYGSTSGKLLIGIDREYCKSGTHILHTLEANETNIQQNSHAWFYQLYCNNISFLNKASRNVLLRKAITWVLLHIREIIRTIASTVVHLKYGVQFQLYETDYLNENKLSNIIVIFFHLIFNFYYTQAVDATYQGPIMYFAPTKVVSGIASVGQLIIQLYSIQRVAKLGQMVACARRGQLIEFGYGVFFLILVIRVLYLYARIQLSWVPSMICVRLRRFSHSTKKFFAEDAVKS